MSESLIFEGVNLVTDVRILSAISLILTRLYNYIVWAQLGKKHRRIIIAITENIRINLSSVIFV